LIRTQALVIMELPRATGHRKTFSQCWKWSHLIADRVMRNSASVPEAVPADETFVLGGGITSRMPVPTTACLLTMIRKPAFGSGRTRRDEWILNGEKCSSRTPTWAGCFSYSRAPTRTSRRRGRAFLRCRSTLPLRVGKVFNRAAGVFTRTPELIFENARVPHATCWQVDGGLKARGGKFANSPELEYAANAWEFRRRNRDGHAKRRRIGRSHRHQRNQSSSSNYPKCIC